MNNPSFPIKLSGLALSAVLGMTMTAAVRADIPNFHYEYVELSAGISELDMKVQNKDDSLRTDFVRGAWSGRITPNVYSTFSFSHFTGDGDRGKSSTTSFRTDAETTQTDYMMLVGYIQPISNKVDVFAAGGVGVSDEHTDIKTSFNGKTTKLKPSYVDRTDTKFAWQLGARTQLSRIVSLETIVTGIAVNPTYSLEVPVAVSKNFNVKVGLAYTNYDSKQKFNRSNSELSLGLRYNY